MPQPPTPCAPMFTTYAASSRGSVGSFTLPRLACRRRPGADGVPGRFGSQGRRRRAAGLPRGPGRKRDADYLIFDQPASALAIVMAGSLSNIAFACSLENRYVTPPRSVNSSGLLAIFLPIATPVAHQPSYAMRYFAGSASNICFAWALVNW